MNHERPGQSEVKHNVPGHLASEAETEILEGSEEMQYVRLLWQRRYFILFFVFIFVGLGIFQLNRAQPVYTSVAVLKFEPSSRQVVELGERSQMIYQRDEIRTAVELIRAPKIGEAVLESLGGMPQRAVSAEDGSASFSLRSELTGFLRQLRSKIVSYEPAKVDEERLAKQNAVRSLLNSVSARTKPDTQLIELYVSRTKAAEATRICEEFCNQFILNLQDEKRQGYNYMRQTLTDQIEDTKERLKVNEKRIFDMSGDSDLLIQEQSRELALDTMAQLTRAVDEQRTEVRLAKADMENAEFLATQKLMTENTSLIRPLIDKRNQLVAEKAALSAENQEDFRPLRRVTQQLQSMEEQIANLREEYTQVLISDIQARYRAEQLKLEELEGRLSQHEAKLRSIDEELIDFRPLQREVDSNRQVLAALLDQFQRLEVLDDVTPNNVTIVSDPTIPTAPSSPNVTKTLISFTVIGALIGAAIVLLMNWLDRSVKSPEVVESKLQIPSLALLPYMRKGSPTLSLSGRRSKAPVLLNTSTEEKNHRGLEAFRYLRTSINYSRFDQDSRILLVTSALPQEGKSTVSSNLALMYAEQGEKVLIIDSDLRRPSIHRMFEINRSPGTTDVLTQQADFDGAVVTSSYENIDILPAGMSTPSPTALLESTRMKSLLNDLRSRYSVIIVDCSPSEGMADSLVLASMCDGVVFVVKQGSTPLATLGRITQKMRSIGANVLGVVYNNTRQSSLGEGYGYYYNYYYSTREN